MSVRMKRSAQPFAFRGADEGGRALDAEEGELVLEGVGHVLTAVVVPDGEAPGDVFAERPEAPAHALSDRLERFEAGATPGGVNADTFGAVVVDGDEHGDLALGGPGRGHVGAPHRVDRVWMMVPSWLRGPRR